jgi:membrane dipeptidase
MKNGSATVGLPEAIVGRVAVVFATLFVAPKSAQQNPWQELYYEDAQTAHRLALKQLDYYHRITDEDDRLRLVRTQADLDAVLATWDRGRLLTERQQGLVILMENADPIIEPKQFEEWYEQGVRIVGPAWKATRYTGGTGQPGPLTDLGRELLDVMMDFNALLDLSHMAEAAFLESVDRYEGPLIASHSNPRAFSDTDRHLTDEMIRRLAERNGVMGIVLLNRFLDHNWTKADGKQAITIDRVTGAIDYVCQLTGSSAHVGIGSDLDGGFGMESIPLEFDTVADLWLIKDALLARGYTEEDVAAILGGNMTRKLRETLPTGG